MHILSSAPLWLVVLADTTEVAPTVYFTPTDNLS